MTLKWKIARLVRRFISDDWVWVWGREEAMERGHQIIVRDAAVDYVLVCNRPITLRCPSIPEPIRMFPQDQLSVTLTADTTNLDLERGGFSARFEVQRDEVPHVRH